MAMTESSSAGLDRRSFLRYGVTVSGAVVASSAFGGAWARAASVAAAPVRVYVVVIDGLRLDEVPLMSQLSELAGTGTYYTGGRAQMLAETTPNHVSMITGMRSDRHGMAGNGVPFLEDNIGLEPRYLQADSIFTLAHVQAPDLITAEVTSKTYIVSVTKHDRDGDGEVDADSTFTPTIVIPGADFTPDNETATAGIAASREVDPDFLFLSLGDTDRVGHVDAVGGLTAGGPTGAAPAGRLTTIQNTDLLLRAFVQDLQQRGVWDSTVFIVTADHSMDWSTPDSTVSLSEQIAADDLLAGQAVFALNGGAALYALRQPAADTAPEALRRLRAIALATAGVEEAFYIAPNPADGGEEHWVGRVRPGWGLTGDHTGDLVVTVQDGFRIIADSQFDNPIPGNHGHPTTLPIPVIVSGGAPIVRQQRIDPPAGTGPSDSLPGQAENIDLAATAAWLLGLRPPPGGFDGRVLTEAFTERPPARVPAAAVASLPVFTRVGGRDRLETAVLLAQRAFPAGADAVVVASSQRFPDALAGAPLAAQLGAPVLLTPPAGLAPAVAAEVRRLAPASAVVLGGTDALSERVIADLIAAGVPEGGIERIAGQDRFGTAAQIARRLAGVGEDSGGDADPVEGRESSGAFGGEVVLVGGRVDADGVDRSFADALATGPVAGRGARPILLTRPDGLPEATRSALADLPVVRALVAGGTVAVAEGVAAELQERDIRVERLAGVGRYDTGVLLTERAIREGAITDTLYLVSGGAFPDGLAAAPAVLAAGGLLLLVPPDGLEPAPAVRAFLERRADIFVEIVFVGGTTALTPRLEQQVRALITARRTRDS